MRIGRTSVASLALICVMAGASLAHAVGIAGGDTDTAGVSHLEFVLSGESGAGGVGIEFTHVLRPGLELGLSAEQVRGTGGNAGAHTTGHRAALTWVPIFDKRGWSLSLGAELGGDRQHEIDGRIAHERVGALRSALGWFWAEDSALEISIGTVRLHNSAGHSSLGVLGLALEAPLNGWLKLGLEAGKQAHEPPSREIRLISEPATGIECFVALGRQAGNNSVLLGVKLAFGEH